MTGGEGATVFSCGLCGCDFTDAGRSCSPCPFKAGCDLVQCPHCGYHFPRTSRAMEWARRLLAGWRRR
jgi:hypothetical protein